MKSHFLYVLTFFQLIFNSWFQIKGFNQSGFVQDKSVPDTPYINAFCCHADTKFYRNKNCIAQISTEQ